MAESTFCRLTQLKILSCSSSVLVENRRARQSPAKTTEEERDLGNLSDGSHKSLEWDYQVH